MSHEDTHSYEQSFVDRLQNRATAVLAAGAIAVGFSAQEAAYPTNAFGDACTVTAAGDTVCEASGSTGGDEEIDFVDAVPPEDVQIVEPTPESEGEEPVEVREDRPRKTPFINYNQGGGWGDRIARSGCGPTAVAMVFDTLKKRTFKPDGVAAELSPKYYIPGSGTRPEAFAYMGKKHGIEVKPAGFKTAKEVIKDGGLAIVHAKPGYFTANGHYMVLRAVKGQKFMVADPNGKGRHGDSESRPYGPKELRDKGIDKVWTFERK